MTFLWQLTFPHPQPVLQVRFCLAPDPVLGFCRTGSYDYFCSNMLTKPFRDNQLQLCNFMNLGAGLGGRGRGVHLFLSSVQESQSFLFWITPHSRSSDLWNHQDLFLAEPSFLTSQFITPFMIYFVQTCQVSEDQTQVNQIWTRSRRPTS